MTSWLPEYKGSDRSFAGGDVLASLSSCHVNLHASCDFQNTELWRIYHDNWRHPAPPGRCRRQRGVLQPRWPRPPKPLPVLRRDRLGVDVDDLCTTDFWNREKEKKKRRVHGDATIILGGSNDSSFLFDQPVRVPTVSE